VDNGALLFSFQENECNLTYLPAGGGLMIVVIAIYLVMILIAGNALAIALHLLSGQYEVSERLRLYAKRS